jgi:hypothetical protein
MRTPEQLLNLRKVLFNMIGPAANLLLTDEDINNWADSLHRRVHEIPCHWSVRVRTSADHDEVWEDIAREEKVPYVALSVMNISCRNLLNKYSMIEAIMITPIDLATGIEETQDTCIFER